MLKTIIEHYQKITAYNRLPAFEDFREAQLKYLALSFAAMASTLIIGFYAVDILLEFPRRTELFTLRIVTGLLTLAFGVLAQYSRTRTQRTTWFIICFYSLAVYSAILSHLTGGIASNYWAGLNFLLLGWFAVIPYPFHQVIIHGLAYISIYNAILLTTSTGPVARIVEINAYLLGTATIGATASVFNNWFSVQIFESKKEIEMERNKSESLLRNILPEIIADRMKSTDNAVIADHYDNVAVLFADIVNFTPMAAKATPSELVAILNSIFSKFDDLANKYSLEKIKTIGDSYMAISGAPTAKPHHINDLLRFALEIREYIAKHEKERGISLRIGISAGPVVAGVIGKSKFAYDLWGDTVNTASRMESHGVPGEIQVTEEVYEECKDSFVFQDRGTIAIKGKGEKKVYLLVGVG